LTVYPPVAERRERARRIVVKGGPDLPVALAGAGRRVVLTTLGALLPRGFTRRHLGARRR
ncbi:MAG TPA: hypothetical protein VH880_14650, partial [Anaeromyxobacteraceae bacterium]